MIILGSLFFAFWPTLVTDFANAIHDYADLILKPDYADMTCPKPDNADHHNGPINIKYTPLHAHAHAHSSEMT